MRHVTAASQSDLPTSDQLMSTAGRGKRRCSKFGGCEPRLCGLSSDVRPGIWQTAQSDISLCALIKVCEDWPTTRRPRGGMDPAKVSGWVTCNRRIGFACVCAYQQPPPTNGGGSGSASSQSWLSRRAGKGSVSFPSSPPALSSPLGKLTSSRRPSLRRHSRWQTDRRQHGGLVHEAGRWGRQLLQDRREYGPDRRTDSTVPGKIRS